MTEEAIPLIVGTFHFHLTAPRSVLEARHQERVAASDADEPATYDEVAADPTERQVGTLAEIADGVLDSSELAASELASRVASAVGLP